MSRTTQQVQPVKPSQIGVGQFLRARPMRNESMTFQHRSDGTTLASIPLRRPSWLVPPVSWLVPFSSHRRVELDTVGTTVLDMCDGKRTVERIIEDFARQEKLSFREAQLPVTQFLQQLSERGMMAIVGFQNDQPPRAACPGEAIGTSS
jgi:hypothetical protein